MRISIIDDSRANRLVWEIEAKKEGKLVDAFGSGDEFLEECASYSRQTPIFVDYHFGDDSENGGRIAEKILVRGFRRVFIATGFPASSINVPFGVAGVVGKDFPYGGFKVGLGFRKIL